MSEPSTPDLLAALQRSIDAAKEDWQARTMTAPDHASPTTDPGLREALAEAAAEAFDEWLLRMHGVTSSCRHEVEGQGIADALLPVVEDWHASKLAEHVRRAREEAWDEGYRYWRNNDSPTYGKGNPYRKAGR